MEKDSVHWIPPCFGTTESTGARPLRSTPVIQSPIPHMAHTSPFFSDEKVPP